LGRRDGGGGRRRRGAGDRWEVVCIVEWGRGRRRRGSCPPLDSSPSYGIVVSVVVVV